MEIAVASSGAGVSAGASAILSAGSTVASFSVLSSIGSDTRASSSVASVADADTDSSSRPSGIAISGSSSSSGIAVVSSGAGVSVASSVTLFFGMDVPKPASVMLSSVPSVAESDAVSPSRPSGMAISGKSSSSEIAVVSSGAGVSAASSVTLFFDTDVPKPVSVMPSSGSSVVSFSALSSIGSDAGASSSVAPVAETDVGSPSRPSGMAISGKSSSSEISDGSSGMAISGSSSSSEIPAFSSGTDSPADSPVTRSSDSGVDAACGCVFSCTGFSAGVSVFSGTAPAAAVVSSGAASLFSAFSSSCSGCLAFSHSERISCIVIWPVICRSTG